MKQGKPPNPNFHLIHARQHKCWSQETVAAKIGTTRVTISRWEQGLRFPSPHFRELLCALFESTPETLGLLPRGLQPPQSGRAHSRAGARFLIPDMVRRASPARRAVTANEPSPHIQQIAGARSTATVSAVMSISDAGNEALASALSRDLLVLEEYTRSHFASARILELRAQAIELFDGNTLAPRRSMMAWHARLQPANGVAQEFVLIRLPDGSYHPVC